MFFLHWKREKTVALRVMSCLTEVANEAVVVFLQVEDLTEKVASLNEGIRKLNRTTKAVQEAHQQNLDDLYIEEEKLSTLSKVKLKLE